MIVIRLDRMLADRKMRLNDLAAQVGISNVNLSYLKTGKVKAVRFSTLLWFLNLEEGSVELVNSPGQPVQAHRQPPPLVAGEVAHRGYGQVLHPVVDA